MEGNRPRCLGRAVPLRRPLLVRPRAGEEGHRLCFVNCHCDRVLSQCAFLSGYQVLIISNQHATPSPWLSHLRPHRRRLWPLSRLRFRAPTPGICRRHCSSREGGRGPPPARGPPAGGAIFVLDSLQPTTCCNCSCHALCRRCFALATTMIWSCSIVSTQHWQRPWRPHVFIQLYSAVMPLLLQHAVYCTRGTSTAVPRGVRLDAGV